MTDPNTVLASTLGIARRPLRERIARWIGFSYPPFPNTDALDKDTRFVEGAMIINLHLKLGFKDRLLVLLGGNIAVRNYVKTDVRITSSTTIGGWSVLEGGTEFR